MAAISDALASFGSGDAITDVLPEIRGVLDTDAVMVLTPVEAIGGLEVGRFQSAGFADATAVREGFADVFLNQPRRYAWYDPIRPEPEQRNRILEAHSLMKPGEFESSYIYARVLRPCGLHEHRQPRVLLCEGASLLAWFGSFQSAPVTRRQLRLLRQLAGPMKRRLSLERKLTPAVQAAGLAAALDDLGAPALVLAGQRIVELNASARALLIARRRELQEALASPGGTTAFEMDSLPIRLNGCADLRLVIVRVNTQEARIAAAVARATACWRLSPRSACVLARVMCGDPSATIAADLAVSRRAVEQQLTVLFERAGVGSRAELVAAALLG